MDQLGGAKTAPMFSGFSWFQINSAETTVSYPFFLLENEGASPFPVMYKWY